MPKTNKNNQGTRNQRDTNSVENEFDAQGTQKITRNNAMKPGNQPRKKK